MQTLDSNVLLLIQLIMILNRPCRLFWDNGSTATLITYEFAHRLELVISPVSYSMQTMDSDGWISKSGELFEVPLTDNDGYEYKQCAYGVDNIAEYTQTLEIN